MALIFNSSFIGLLRDILPDNIRFTLTQIRDRVSDFIQFEIYAYRFNKPRLEKKIAERDKAIKYLFVLSPMRAGSTLLTHVLNGHSEIVGYGENHVSYKDEQDLFKLIARTSHLAPDFQGTETYVMDKLVWNYDVSDEILQSDKTRFLFLLRDPNTNFKSMEKLKDHRPWDDGVKVWADHEKCLQYFNDRLNFMLDTARRINDPKRVLLIEYEALLGNTDRTLQAIQDFLSLETPISGEYSTSKISGQFRYGDPSNNLKLGKILPPSKAVVQEPDSPAVTKAREVYADSIESFRQYCDVVITYWSLDSAKIAVDSKNRLG